MKENPSPGPGGQRVFSPKRPVPLLMMTIAFCFILLFVSTGQIHAASATSASVRSMSTASLPLSVNLSMLGDGYGISSPVNGQIILSAQVITSDPNEVVANVAFYSSTGGSIPILLGTAQVVSPEENGIYKLTWTPSAPNVYSLTAKAYDTLGNVATSNTVTANIVVPTPPPPLIVTITSPANGSVSTLPAKIPFSASIAGVIGSNNFMFVISFTATLLPNGPTYGVGTVTQNDPRAFSVTWVPPQAGTYSLVVKADFTDEAGAQSGTSTPVTVHVNAPSCSVSYQLKSQWSGGFNVNAVLTNTSSAPIHGWTLAFPFPGDQKITDLWNGSYTQTGVQVTITNLSYNSSIAPGGTVDIGFNGAWISNESNPTAFTLNGQSCGTT